MSTPAGFTFIANFASSSNVQSVTVSLYDGLDRSVGQLTLNRSAGNQITLTGITPGNYVVKAIAYSAPNAGGAVVSNLNEWVAIGASTSLTASIGTVPVSATVSSISGNVPLPESRRVYGVLLDASGLPVFTDTTAFTYQVLGGVGTIDNSGIFQSTTAGSGSIRATHTTSGLVGAAPVTVIGSTPTSSKWTVLVYLNAANDLDIFSEPNVKQMLKVSDNPDVRFVLQWKQVQNASISSPSPSFVGTKRILLGTDKQPHLVQDMGTSVDMGDKNTLRNFIAWGQTQYPSARTCLVIWNHGNGWSRAAHQAARTRGISYDADTGNNIQTWDLTYALGPTKLDIIAMDASLMQMLEVLYEMKDSASYIAGSEESPPAAGYPYDVCFKPMHDNPDDTSVNISKGFVDGMVAAYGTSTEANLTQSVVDTGKLPAVATALDTLGTALKANAASLQTAVPAARAASRKYEPEISGRYYYDLDQICTNLKAQTTLPAVTSACDGVKSAIANAVLFNGVNANSANSKGIGIDFSPAQYYTTYSSDYVLLKLAGATSWPTWLAVAP